MTCEGDKLSSKKAMDYKKQTDSKNSVLSAKSAAKKGNSASGN
ncbi:MAG: hypothetical protein ACXVNM_00985 [Bacteroidia bacterium]